MSSSRKRSKRQLGAPASSIVPASEFKAHCLRLFDDVDQQGKTFTVTKHGRPVAIVGPIQKRTGRTLGLWKDLGVLSDDMVKCDWSQEFEATRE